MTIQQRPRIETLTVKNFRVLRDVQLKKLTPLTVLIGPNGSGKTTLFEVFAFLSECFQTGLRPAWSSRGKLKELRTRGSNEPVVIELKYREARKEPLITYRLEIDERGGRPVVAREFLRWSRFGRGKPFRFLDFEYGRGFVVSGEFPDETAERVQEELESPEILAVSTLGQFAKHPRASALRRFITSWYLSYLSADSARGIPEAGPQERLSKTGDNLPNVIEFLNDEHPDRLNEILARLTERVPTLESVSAELMADGRLLLLFKDGPFKRPIQSKYVSDGTLKMLAYLTILHDPDPPQFIGIEEPENYLYPTLLRELAEECQQRASTTQLFVTTHSPEFVNTLKPKEVWAVSRGADGLARIMRSTDFHGVSEQIEAGAVLGDLWLEGFLQS